MKREPEWWSAARRLYKLRFRAPGGKRVGLTIVDIARILRRYTPSQVRYAVSDRWREGLKQAMRIRQRGLEPEVPTCRAWVYRWREQWRKEMGERE
jgi:hypothetical protein